jgi:hypothetical protein
MVMKGNSEDIYKAFMEKVEKLEVQRSTPSTALTRPLSKV